MNELQYQVLAQKRCTYDTMLWQTPVISLAGQAFLFTIALGEADALSRLPASVLIILVSWASVELMARHRQHEVFCSRLLAKHERSLDGSVADPKKLTVLHEPIESLLSAHPDCRPPADFDVEAKSLYTIWSFVLACFGVAGIFALCRCIIEMIQTPT